MTILVRILYGILLAIGFLIAQEIGIVGTLLLLLAGYLLIFHPLLFLLLLLFLLFID